MDRAWFRTYLGVFAILMGSYAYFWHSRDWNTASRLMLTYAIVDHGRLSIDGLENQTGDRAYFRGHFYSDKLPGYPFLAMLPCAFAETFLGYPPHPLGVPAMAHWGVDYWVTLATSGLLSALTAVMLAVLARAFGCTPRQAAVVALAYGLATPAYVYATLAYGHQTTAFCLLGSFMLLSGRSEGRNVLRIFTAGLLASFAAVVELQVGPVSAVLGLFLIGQCLAGTWKPAAIVYFALGALGPALGLLLYNQLAFGNPLDMGYFHHATAIFARVHSKENPLGLRPPDWGLARPLLMGRYRGLLFYAPIVVLAIPGWAILIGRRWLDAAAVSFLAVLAVFVDNLSYPEWTGGWSTGPRLLVPLLPFAMIPVAAALSARGGWGRAFVALGSALAIAGGVLMLLFQGVGARIPQDVADPLVEVVWPLWTDRSLPPWWPGERFARNLGGLAAWRSLRQVPEAWRWVQFAPLVAFQAAFIARLLRRRDDPAAKVPPDADGVEASRSPVRPAY
jgi:hypothetical protein